MERDDKTPIEHVISSLDQEIVVLTLTTLVRLFELDPDATLLYLFYCKNAKIQANNIGYTNKIFAGREFCMQGLQWGKKRYQNAKKLLKENGFVEDVVKKNEDGTIQGWYVQLNFLQKSQEPHASKEPSGSYNSVKTVVKPLDLGNHPLVEPPSGDRPTNAVNKNRNAVNENIISQKSPNPITLYQSVSPADGISDYRPKKTDSKILTEETMRPLTPEKLWEIAHKKQVSYEEARFIHEQVLNSIRDGNRKYKIKDINLTVQKWIDLAIGRGNMQRLDEVGRMVLESQDPARRKRLLEELKKYE